jgi:hypothetical protein
MLDNAYFGIGDSKVGKLQKNHETAGWVITQMLKNNDLPYKDAKRYYDILIGQTADAAFFKRFLA